MELEKYSIGIGDRFELEGAAQLRALQAAGRHGVDIAPVWNKSNREHTIIGTSPADTRRAADEAVRVSAWKRSYYLDADHIGLGTVDRFLEPCNFFTIDVADDIGKPADASDIRAFVDAMKKFTGTLTIPRMQEPVRVDDGILTSIAQKYLAAIMQAGKVYRYIAGKKGAANFIPEVSVDEAGSPQTPAELFFILAAIARERIPVQTIAPKFTGEFLKGIDYVGDIRQFTREFEDNLAVIAFAVETFNLPSTLKLSVHSGSDKFSLYPIMHAAMKKFDAGIHLKTAGTTWLEEVIGLAASGGEALDVVKEIYRAAIGRYDELCKPYLPVIAIDKTKLPAPREVDGWASTEFVGALQHNQASAAYNIHFRQFVHVSFKIAAEILPRYRKALMECRGAVESNVTTNIFDRHIQALFLGRRTTANVGGSGIQAAA